MLIVSSTWTQTSNHPAVVSDVHARVSQTMRLSPPQSTVQAPSTTSQVTQPLLSSPIMTLFFPLKNSVAKPVPSMCKRVPPFALPQ